LPVELGESSVDQTYFFPSGQADPQTWWLTSRYQSNSQDQYRIFVLPISGLTEIASGW
jgi:hypothetical protein